MVATKFDFNPPDVTTPHGGPLFHGWKQGWGFGKAKGPGGYVGDASIPARLNCTPSGDRGLASNPFWRGKLQVGQASSFGIGPRPDYGLEQKDSVAPDNYGDVSRRLDASRATPVRKGISVKPRFPSMEERYRNMSWPTSGPGPAKYDTSYACGQSSWTSPCKLPKYTFGVRPTVDKELVYRMQEPAPGQYPVQGQVGRNPKTKHGTLYDISMKGRLPFKGAGASSPGPAKYHIRGHFDEYSLWSKIQNVKPSRPRRSLPPRGEMPAAASTGAFSPMHTAGSSMLGHFRSAVEEGDEEDGESYGGAEDRFGASDGFAGRGLDDPAVPGGMGTSASAPTLTG